jgi:hypothetical protein
MNQLNSCKSVPVAPLNKQCVVGKPAVYNAQAQALAEPMSHKVVQEYIGNRSLC